MKKIWKIRKDKEGVSPVIATILMVAITVVLAAVLYVMVIQFNEEPVVNAPMGYTIQSRNSTSVTLLVASAPTGSKIYSTSISLTQNGIPTQISNATVYDSSAAVIATFDGGTWSYHSGMTEDTAEFTAGTMVVINASAINVGDEITITSGQNFYGTTTFTVS